MSSPETDARVTIVKDGPYLVRGAVPLSRQTIGTDAEGGSEAWIAGEAVEAPARYALCRCGQSKTKPFCDGTHATVGFDGTETASREPYLDQAKVLDGPVVALMDTDALCAFGRFCDTHGKVWNQVSRTDNPAIGAQFISKGKTCPAGHLVAWDKAAGAPIEPELPVSIGLVEDPPEDCAGPLWLRGGIQVVGADGFEYEVRNRVTLCRCGASKNKPFCDGSHASVGFQDK